MKCKHIFFAGFSILIYVFTILAVPSAINEIIYGISACTACGNFIAVYNTSPPYVIAVDSGHGGMDTGAQAIADEIDVIDMTASYLFELLENDPNFIPVLTRTDSDPESSERAYTANNAGASLFISIHANSDSSASSHGFECFPTPPGRTHHYESLKFAAILASKMKAEGHSLRGGEEKTGIKYAYYNGKQKIIVDSTDNKVRSMQSFGVLEKTNCPAVLVEQCFLSNYSDVNNWTGDAGCSRAAKVYYEAIKRYFSDNRSENEEI